MNAIAQALLQGMLASIAQYETSAQQGIDTYRGQAMAPLDQAGRTLDADVAASEAAINQYLAEFVKSAQANAQGRDQRMGQIDTQRQAALSKLMQDAAQSQDAVRNDVGDSRADANVAGAQASLTAQSSLLDNFAAALRQLNAEGDASTRNYGQMVNDASKGALKSNKAAATGQLEGKRAEVESQIAAQRMALANEVAKMRMEADQSAAQMALQLAAGGGGGGRGGGGGGRRRGGGGGGGGGVDLPAQGVVDALLGVNIIDTSGFNDIARNALLSNGFDFGAATSQVMAELNKTRLANSLWKGNTIWDQHNATYQHKNAANQLLNAKNSKATAQTNFYRSALGYPTVSPTSSSSKKKTQSVVVKPQPKKSSIGLTGFRL